MKEVIEFSFPTESFAVNPGSCREQKEKFFLLMKYSAFPKGKYKTLLTTYEGGSGMHSAGM